MIQNIQMYFKEQETKGYKFVSGQNNTIKKESKKMNKIMKFASVVLMSGALLVGCSSKDVSPEPKHVAAASNIDHGYKLIEVWKTAETSKGIILFDPRAEFEKDILVTNENVEKWNLQDLEVGQKVVGVFDKEGWTLLDVMKVENNYN
ncbi:hypothetical protein [Priestia megaterium]|uniref:hypothetical protein n=1 Tax=Priestia megaterium TaxID=1404 RepID=UPI00211C53F0|nr:hypothetical protein [Priestia megaterium]